MFRIVWTLSIYTRIFMRRFMPTNIALDALRSRRGLKWGVSAMLLAIVYFYVASFITVLIEQGSPKWLYLVALLCIWNAMKFIINGIISIGVLVRIRVVEHRIRSASQQAVDQQLAEA